MLAHAVDRLRLVGHEARVGQLTGPRVVRGGQRADFAIRDGNDFAATKGDDPKYADWLTYVND